MGRQLAVRAQLPEATRPTDLADLVDRLTLLHAIGCQLGPLERRRAPCP